MTNGDQKKFLKTCISQDVRKWSTSKMGSTPPGPYWICGLDVSCSIFNKMADTRIWKWKQIMITWQMFKQQCCYHEHHALHPCGNHNPYLNSVRDIEFQNHIIIYVIISSEVELSVGSELRLQSWIKKVRSTKTRKILFSGQDWFPEISHTSDISVSII